MVANLAAAGSSASDSQRIFRGERAPPLVREVFEAKGYREHDEEEDGDNWHVHWKAGRFKPSEYEAANRGQRVNHFPKTTGITKKDNLLRNLRRMRGIHGPIFNFFPDSYILPTEYMSLVRYCEGFGPDEKPVWIVKPTDSSQGRKIFLIRDLSEISYGHFSASMMADDDEPPRPGSERALFGSSGRGGGGFGGGECGASCGAASERSHGVCAPGYRGGIPADQRVDDKGRAILSSIDMSTTLKMLKSRLKKEVTPCVKFTEMHIVQRYVDRPMCFCGYKLDLRIYVLLLSAQPLRVYWYRDALVRFATHKYDMDDIDNQYSHLTNTSINKFSSAYRSDKEGVRGGCKWSLWRFQREHPDHPLNSTVLWARIKAQVNLTLLSIAADVAPHDNGGCFELLGFDVIVDEHLKPWLLEVNTSPALGVECDVDRHVKEPLLADLVELLAVQQATADAPSCPAGGGAAAARASRMGRGGSGGSSGGGSGSSSGSSGGGGGAGSSSGAPATATAEGGGSSGGGGGGGRGSGSGGGAGSGAPAAAVAGGRGGGGRGGGASGAGGGGGGGGAGGRGGGGADRKAACSSGGRAASNGATGGPAGARARQAQANSVQRLPERCGGYEVIFPFNEATAALAECIGGNEAAIVGEIKGELQQYQKEKSAAAPAEAPERAPRRPNGSRGAPGDARPAAAFGRDEGSSRRAGKGGATAVARVRPACTPLTNGGVQ